MKKFNFKNNIFSWTFTIIIFFSIGYKIYKVYDEKVNKITKEVVTIYLKYNEIEDGMIEAVSRFNKAHEDIYIRLRVTGEDYDNIVHTKLANEYDIDILEYNGRTLLDKDFIRPLSSIGMNLTNIKDNSFLLYNEDIIGIKYGMAMPKLLYNKEILNGVGVSSSEIKTLDDLLEVSRKIKKMYNIVPINLSLENIHDIFSILGTSSTAENSTYPTFWNYRSGEYDFSGLSKVLNYFKIMYEEGLINKDFEAKDNESLFNGFKNEKTAIMPVNYYQKYSVRDRLEGMNLDFSNIPFTSEGGKLYYYTYARTLVLANNNNKTEMSSKELERDRKHDEAVKYVFEWLISEQTTNYLIDNDYNFASFSNYNIDKSDKLYGMNDNRFYLQNIKDPTEVLAGNSELTRDYVYKMIKGEIDIETGISNLTKELNEFIKTNARNVDIDLEKYKE